MFPNPPRSTYSKIGCWNFFAVSPVVWQMQHSLPHTLQKGWQITYRCSRAEETYRLLHQLVSVTRVFLMSTLCS